MSWVILVPIHPAQFQSADWVAVRDQRQVEFSQWLEERGLVPFRDYDYEFVKCLFPSDLSHGHVFYFEHPSDAMLFRLTFGGMASHVRSRGAGDGERP